MYRLINGQLYYIIEVVTPNQIALVTTTAHSVQGYDSDVPLDIDAIPEKNEAPGKVGELHFINGALEWVYVDKPVTVDDRIDDLKTSAQTLEERTVGMQAIDEFTLQSQTTIDDRTKGMQAIDDYTLQLVNDQAALIAQLQADIATLKGGV